ncbi:MAG: hypothetical protein FJ316_04250 [SAR202 cluster bacterium]|nr:hypothetical protein [SAR202 cluster bacterium]
MNKKRRRTRLVHQGKYAAEVDIELIDDETGWAPYLSLADAQRLNDVRDALRQENISRASQFGRVYRLTPVNA